jgi:hypothetical protein
MEWEIIVTYMMCIHPPQVFRVVGLTGICRFMYIPMTPRRFAGKQEATLPFRVVHPFLTQ